MKRKKVSSAETLATGAPGDEEDAGQGAEDETTHQPPLPRLQQTAASKRRRTPSTTSRPAGIATEETTTMTMTKANSPSSTSGTTPIGGVSVRPAKRRRRGLVDLNDHYAFAKDIKDGAEEIEVKDGDYHVCTRGEELRHLQPQNQQVEEEGGLVTRATKKAKASSAEAGRIPPMRAFAEAVAAAAVANGPLGSFSMLPAEIMLHLLSFLSGKDVCHVRLTSSECNRLGKDQMLWKVICLREFESIPNRLFQQPFGKSWEWLYRSKAVVHSSKDGIKDGAVCCYKTKECRYEGEWKEKELDGYGIELWSDGEEYEGWSTQGRLNGYGRASYTSGDTYIGMWKSGLRDGGIYVWSDGWKYEGEYQDGKLTGRGTLLFKNGSKYTGQWLDGERHGQGTMMYFDGSRYEGEWKHDKREGRGILYWPTTTQPADASSLASPPASAASPSSPHAARSSSSSFPSPPPSSSSGIIRQEETKHMRYEGFWRDDQILEGGKVLWDDGAELSLEEALKRLR
jgi:hypothetical protein